MSGYSNEVTARCHCGAVTLNAKLSAGFSTKRRCDCSFCRRRSAAAVTARLGDVEITKGEDKLTLYQWGTNTAKHYFCSVCGIYMYHQRRSNPEELGVNIYAIDGQLPQDHEPIGWSDGINHPSDRER